MRLARPPLIAITIAVVGCLAIVWAALERDSVEAVPVPHDWSLLPEGARALALEAVEACRENLDDPAAFARLGRIYHGNVEPALAIASYEHALALGVDDPRTPYLLALLHEDWGQTQQAIEMLRLAVQREPAYAPAHFHLGRNLLHLADTQSSITAFRRATELDSGDASFHVGLGQALRQAGRLGQAEAALRTALSIDPQHAGAHQLLGLTLRAAGKDTDANTHLARLRPYFTEVVRDPWLWEAQQHATSVETRVEWARSYLRTGRVKDALKVLSRLAADHPESAEVLRRLGEAQALGGRFDLAAQSYARALQIEPQDTMTRTALAFNLLQRGDLAAAQREVTLALGDDPENFDALLVQAAIRVRQGRAAEVVDRLQELAGLQRHHVPAHFWLGEALTALQRFDEAVALYEHLVQLEPGQVAFEQRLVLARKQLAARSGNRP